MRAVFHEKKRGCILGELDFNKQLANLEVEKRKQELDFKELIERIREVKSMNSSVIEQC